MARAQQRRVRNARILTRNKPWTPNLIEWFPVIDGTDTVVFELGAAVFNATLNGIPQIIKLSGQEAPIAASLTENFLSLQYPSLVTEPETFYLYKWDPALRDEWGGFLTQKQWVGENPPEPVNLFEWSIDSIAGSTIVIQLDPAHTPYIDSGVPAVQNVTTAELPVSVVIAGSLMTLTYTTPPSAGDVISWPSNDAAIEGTGDYFNGWAEVTIPAPPPPSVPTFLQWTSSYGPGANFGTINFTSPVGAITYAGGVDVITGPNGFPAASATLVGSTLELDFGVDITAETEMIVQTGSIFLYTASLQVLRPHGVAF